MMTETLTWECLDNPRARKPRMLTLTVSVGDGWADVAPVRVRAKRMMYAMRMFKRSPSPAVTMYCPDGRVMLASVKDDDGARWFAVGTGSVMYWMTPEQFDKLEQALKEASDGN